MHYYQRPDADHLGVDGAATSLSGHAGTFRFARYGNSKWRWANATRWVSPGFDLNDIGFLRQADFIVNEASGGYVQTDPTGPFRTWGVTVERQDAFDYSGARTDAVTGVQASGTFDNKWTVSASVNAIEEPNDTRLLRGGPSMLTSGFWGTFFSASTDPSRRVVLGGQLRRQFGVEAGTHESEVSGLLRWRVSQRLVLQPVVAYAKNLDDLQYVETAETSGGPRYLLGRIDQDTLAVTFRADLQITPDLSIQDLRQPVRVDRPVHHFQARDGAARG